jgi:hypothetical protein
MVAAQRHLACLGMALCRVIGMIRMVSYPEPQITDDLSPPTERLLHRQYQAWRGGLTRMNRQTLPRHLGSYVPRRPVDMSREEQRASR